MLNGRQKAMTAALMGAEDRRASGNVSGTPSPIEASKLLMYIAEQVRDGLLAVRDMRMETFQEPRYRSLNTLDSPYEQQAMIQNDQFATIMLEVAPSGRVADRATYVNVEGSVLDPNNVDASLDAALDDPNEAFEPFNPGPAVKAKRSKAAPIKDATPTGASAARDIIFDEPEDDPT